MGLTAEAVGNTDWIKSKPKTIRYMRSKVIVASTYSIGDVETFSSPYSSSGIHDTLRGVSSHLTTGKDREYDQTIVPVASSA